MGKPKLMKKKSSLAQTKISNFFKIQSGPDSNCQQFSLNTSRQILSKPGRKQEAVDIPVIVLDDSTPGTPHTRSGTSLDFIAATPKSEKKSMLHNVDSPEIIPATPLTFQGKKSRFCLDKKLSSCSNKSVVSSCRNEDIFSVKRRADSATGLSPNAKKVNHTDENLEGNASLVKRDIFKKIAPTSVIALEDEKSPSILQTFIYPTKISPKGLKSSLSNGISIPKCSTNLCNNIIRSFEHCTGNKIPEPCVTNELPYKTNVDQRLKPMEIGDSSKLNMDFDLDDDIIKFLTDNIDQMSPFKTVPIRDETKCKINYEKEMIGVNSFAASGHYNRHMVTFVDKKASINHLVLSLKSLLDGSDSTCNLSGFWYDTYIKEGDIVNIQLIEKLDGVYNVTNTQGILVVNPDVLISGTSVVAGVFCRRKAILNEKFKGVDGGNKSMLIGSLVHELFQEIVDMKNVMNIDLEHLVNKLVYQKGSLLALYGLKLTEMEISSEIKSFLPAIEKWRDMYMEGSQPHGRDEWNGIVCDVMDIEENIWSPRYGIKGKMDLTIRTRSKGIEKVMPLELKTGKASYSAEHRGQVTLYSMMSSDRREDPKSGLLLYLKNLSMKEIPSGDKEKSGLMQLRNELVSYLYQRMDDKVLPSLPRLPAPLDSERICQRCPHLLTCSTLLTIQKEVPPEPHSMSTLAPNSVAHLSQSHLDYFRHWCLLLHLETWKETGNFRNKALWCKNAKEREEMGECIGMLKLSEDCPVKDCGSSQYIHNFIRDFHLYGDIPKKIFMPGDSVIISSNSEIALSIGVVFNIDEKCIAVTLDRNLQKYPSWRSKVFRVDRCEYQSTMGIIYTNLISLLKDGSHFEHLRQLLVGRGLPKFCAGFDKLKVPLMKPILKNLNKIQQRAVLRVLLAEDFLIIKGFPGTGKTSTVVCLVRLLVLFGFSVLLTSYTHSAVDTILLKLKEHEDCPFLRLGKLSRINPELRQYSEDVLLNDVKTVDQVTTVINSKPVVATTCLGVNHPVFKRRAFDYCIIDEAAQVLQPAAIGTLFHCKKFVLVGDPLQLPPVVRSQAAKIHGMTETLLDRLDCEAGTICLIQQYRMNREIQRIVNHLTYSDQLECATESVAEATLPEHSAIEKTTWLNRITSSDIDDSVVFVDTNGSSPEGRDGLGHPVNAAERDIISDIVVALGIRDISPEDIGIITPYRGQVNLLRSSVALIEINTVDQFQGKDRLIIVYSCVKSALSSEVKDSEILNDERRLNVAITRAKCKLVFVGDKATLALYSPFKKLFNILRPNQFVSLLEE